MNSNTSDEQFYLYQKWSNLLQKATAQSACADIYRLYNKIQTLDKNSVEYKELYSQLQKLETEEDVIEEMCKIIRQNLREIRNGTYTYSENDEHFLEKINNLTKAKSTEN